jgi:hypothetical protein
MLLRWLRKLLNSSGPWGRMAIVCHLCNGTNTCDCWQLCRLPPPQRLGALPTATSSKSSLTEVATTDNDGEPVTSRTFVHRIGRWNRRAWKSGRRGTALHCLREIGDSEDSRNLQTDTIVWWETTSNLTMMLFSESGECPVWGWNCQTSVYGITNGADDGV